MLFTARALTEERAAATLMAMVDVYILSIAERADRVLVQSV